MARQIHSVAFLLSQLVCVLPTKNHRRSVFTDYVLFIVRSATLANYRVPTRTVVLIEPTQVANWIKELGGHQIPDIHRQTRAGALQIRKQRQIRRGAGGRAVDVQARPMCLRLPISRCGD